MAERTKHRSKEWQHGYHGGFLQGIGIGLMFMGASTADYGHMMLGIIQCGLALILVAAPIILDFLEKVRP